MGGEEAIGAAATDDRIRAVVAEGATGRTAADKAWLSEEYGLAGVVQETMQPESVSVWLRRPDTDGDPAIDHGRIRGETAR